MKADEFREWQRLADLNNREAADALGKSADSVTVYRTSGVPKSQALTLRLAMAAVLGKVEPWFRGSA